MGCNSSQPVTPIEIVPIERSHLDIERVIGQVKMMILAFLEHCAALRRLGLGEGHKGQPAIFSAGRLRQGQRGRKETRV